MTNPSLYSAAVYSMERFLTRVVTRLTALLLLTFAPTPVSLSYSVLAHEAIIDSSWEASIKPLLLQRFPHATAEQLRQAHAYAYGGCIIQDMGYYPFGSPFFSQLTHYVRTGNFIQALIQESQNINEYAFALGAVSHYAADNNGHPLAVNRSVPIIYPKLRARYGNEVTYGDDPKAHVLVEFSFDVVQVAGGGYLPEAYHDFIGFQVAKPVLERAFRKTYGLDIRDVLFNEDLAIGTYRRAAGKIIPQMTKVAWHKKRADIERVSPGITRRKFIYKLSRRSYEKEFGRQYERPGLLVRFLVFVFSIIPKVGRLQTLAFKPPTPQTEHMFLESLKVTHERYHSALDDLKAGHLDLPDSDCDTGKPTQAGEYRLADATYAELLERLQKDNFGGFSPELRDNILSFYAYYQPPYATEHDRERWHRTVQALYKLRAAPLQLANTVAK